MNNLLDVFSLSETKGPCVPLINHEIRTLVVYIFITHVTTTFHNNAKILIQFLSLVLFDNTLVQYSVVTHILTPPSPLALADVPLDHSLEPPPEL